MQANSKQYDSPNSLDKTDGLPLVSIITPSFNALPYLKETIKSVREQSYPSLEHLVIDGGSNDGTAAFLAEQPDLRWISEPDRGQSHALNKGFNMAKGEIIGWLNADDTYEPGAVCTAVDWLLDNQDVDLVYADLNIIDGSSKKIGSSRSRPFDLSALLFSNYINQPTVFMRRRVTDLLGGVDEALDFTMDHEYWLRAGLAGFNLKYLPGRRLSNFRLFPGTKSFDQSLEFHREWILVLKRLVDFPSPDGLPHANVIRAHQKSRAQLHLWNMIRAVERSERKVMLQHLIHAIKLDWKLVTNHGTWLFLTRGLLGLKVHRLRKYRK